MSSIWKERSLILVFFAAIASALLGPISSDVYVPAQYDFINHIVTIAQAKLALLEGQFPLRVSPLEYNGLRYPLFQFYSPTTYTVAGIIYGWLTPTNPFSAYKLTLWLSLTLGGVYFYRLSCLLVRSKPAAILAALVYLTSPYCIFEVNYYGAFNESIALGLVPAVLYYSVRRFVFPLSDLNLVLAAFFWYLLATTHLITFFYTSVFFAILFILVLCARRKYMKNFVSLGVAYGFACLMAMWYLAPVTIMGKYLIISRTFAQLTSGHMHVLLMNLLSPGAFIPGGLGRLSKESLSGSYHPSLGWPIVVAVGVTFYALFTRENLGRTLSRIYLVPLLILFSLVLFLVWSPINVWIYLPKSFQVIQYSWRLLGQAVWMGGVIFAWAICWIFRNKMDIKHVIVGFMLCVISTSAWFTLPGMQLIKLKPVLDNPVISEGYRGAYLVDGNRNTQLVTILDRMPLYFLSKKDEKNKIDFGVAHDIANTLLATAVDPQIMVYGKASGIEKKHLVHLKAFANGKTIGAYTVDSGDFIWKIPVGVIKHMRPLFFKIEPLNVNDSFRLNYYCAISGFLTPREFIGLDVMQKKCKLSGEDTVCHVQVPSSVKLVELPILFYPDMMDVTLDGRPVAYYSVYYDDKLIVGIEPKANQLNNITVHFRGLLWANYVSQCAWGIWLIFILYVFASRVVNRKRV